MKHVKGDKWGSHDAFQNNYDKLDDSSTPYCWTYYIPCKTKGLYLGISFCYMQPPWKVTCSKPVKSPYISSFFSFGSMLIYISISLQSIGYYWSTVESYVVNSVGRYGGRNITGKMKCTASGNYLSFINLIKGGYVIFQDPNINWKSIFESIWSKSFQ